MYSLYSIVILTYRNSNWTTIGTHTKQKKNESTQLVLRLLFGIVRVSGTVIIVETRGSDSSFKITDITPLRTRLVATIPCVYSVTVEIIVIDDMASYGGNYDEFTANPNRWNSWVL